MINLYRLLLNDPGDRLGERWGSQGSWVGPVVRAGGHQAGRVERPKFHYGILAKRKGHQTSFQGDDNHPGNRWQGNNSKSVWGPAVVQRSSFGPGLNHPHACNQLYFWHSSVGTQQNPFSPSVLVSFGQVVSSEFLGAFSGGWCTNKEASFFKRLIVSFLKCSAN